MFKKRCKSNKNKTNIQFFHNLFTGYFIKYFNPLPFHLIIKEKSHPKVALIGKASVCTTPLYIFINLITFQASVWFLVSSPHG